MDGVANEFLQSKLGRRRYRTVRYEYDFSNPDYIKALGLPDWLTPRRDEQINHRSQLRSRNQWIPRRPGPAPLPPRDCSG